MAALARGFSDRHFERGEDPGDEVANEDGDLFKMAATAKRARRSGYEMISKMAEKPEVQFKKKKEEKKTSLHIRVLGTRQSVKGLSFAVPCFFFCYFKVRSNRFERARLRNTVPLVDSMYMLLK